MTKKINLDQPKIFISYAHGDGQIEMDQFWNKLKGYLATPDQQWEKWDDREINSGEEWDKVIKTALDNGCNCCLLLISDLFAKSDYIVNTEWRSILDRYEKEGFLFFPVVFGVLNDFKDLPDKMEKFQVYWPSVSELYKILPNTTKHPDNERLCYKEISDPFIQDHFCSHLARQMNGRLNAAR